jgi:hypothetical protein
MRSRFCGYLSLVTTICLSAEWSALNVWKNSSCVCSRPARNWMSSTRSRSQDVAVRARNSSIRWCWMAVMKSFVNRSADT